jgi:hypothetical protein
MKSVICLNLVEFLEDASFPSLPDEYSYSAIN